MATLSRATLFRPVDLAGCVLWLRADQNVVLDASGNVQTWGDMSGQGNHVVQATASKRPAFVATSSIVKPCLSLIAANSQGLSNTNSMVGPTKWTMVSVHQLAALGNQAVLSYGGTASNGNSFTCNGGLRDVDAVSVANRQDGSATTNWETWIGTNDGTTTLFWVNGQLASLTNASTNAAAAGNGVNVGFNTSGVTNMTGNIAEQLMFNRALSAIEVSQLSAYFQRRYGIGAP